MIRSETFTSQLISRFEAQNYDLNLTRPTYRFGGGHDLLPEPGRTVVEYLDELLGEALEEADGGVGVHVREPGSVVRDNISG